MSRQPCFILAHKHVPGYTSFIRLYINNIRAFYGTEAQVIVVNNQSGGGDAASAGSPLDEGLPPGVIILHNDGPNGGYDVGAYIFALKWLFKQGLHLRHEYFVFAQDTYVHIQPLDFDRLLRAGVRACPVVSCYPGHNALGPGHPHHADVRTILEGLRPPGPPTTRRSLYDWAPVAPLCFANTFVVHSSCLAGLLYYIGDFCLRHKPHMEIYERVLPCILCELNWGETGALDGMISKERFSVPSRFFVKFCQAKI